MDKRIKTYRNVDIQAVTVGIPPSHRHVRAVIETEEGVIVLQEATLAALVRAYVNVKTHPLNSAVHLKGTEPEEKKPGYASWQLLEDEEADASKILDELIP